MGYQTDFVGRLEVSPPLSEAEQKIVNRLSGSIYLGRQASGPRPVDDTESLINLLRETAPRGWSNWTSSACGCLLSYDGGDKANHMIPWLKFLMATFLVPGASAPMASPFDGLTRDHVVNGIVVGSRRDNGELYAIVVRDNVVEVESMWPADPAFRDYPPLAYQVEIDRFREWAVERNRCPSLDPDDCR